jgi:hypothetical protein
LCSFTVLAALHRIGVEDSAATSAIAQMWKAGATNERFYRLWVGVSSDVTIGTAPTRALLSRLGELRR